MALKSTAKPKIAPLDEARAALVLRQISTSGTRLDYSWYRDWKLAGVPRGVVDRAVNLLAERGEVRLVSGALSVIAVRLEAGE